ncbi:valyl-tRNA synthetase [Ascobolus immersus RN42]|uniref:valine--tRNA ligase n=1 Tax=Ascobolus immersus RN42 TaxID=1160509 RepID=A0A3N4IK34_ASCIM|nr:valyl-tRNA synthetase [Ascobolus immersus RN42]
MSALVRNLRHANLRQFAPIRLPFRLYSSAPIVPKPQRTPGPKIHPSLLEEPWLKYWASNPPRAPSDSSKPTVRMLLPPPNVTGALHIGHATMLAVQDSLARYFRMSGHKVEWAPGTDHAGIATQSVVEKHLAKTKGVDRHQLGRKGLIAEIEKWREQYGGRIHEQMERIGITTNREKEYYTLSDDLSEAVRRAFVLLHEQGLIYRDTRMVNWCVALQTAVSDIEVEGEDIEEPVKVGGAEFGHLHQFAYRLVEDPSREVIVATTRPETIYGDRAVAVHPEDERYKDLHYKLLQHPLLPDVHVPVIPDAELVDPKFGTGAVKITPAHDQNDYQFWLRHSSLANVNSSEQGETTTKRLPIPLVDVFGLDGKMLSSCGTDSGVVGIDRLHARKRTVKALEEHGVYRGSKPHKMRLGKCSRSGDVIEPMLKPQWYLRTKPLAEKALELSENGGMTIRPDKFVGEWQRWLGGIRDWCLSRQIWWGHQIPAWQVVDASSASEGRWIIATSEEEAMKQMTPEEKSRGCTLRQDEDVLDTWFSSGLLPISTAGWKGIPGDEAWRDNYPLTLMESGSDIIFFWLARMAMLCTWFSGKLPFNEVLLHPIVCDVYGRKMSKSVGNVLDPLHVIEGRTLPQILSAIEAEKTPEPPKSDKNYELWKKSKAHLKARDKEAKKLYPKGIAADGTDALRLALVAYTKRSKINLDLQTVNYYRRLVLKMDSVAHYINLRIPLPSTTPQLPPLDALLPHDIYLLQSLQTLLGQFKTAFETRQLDIAVENAHDFFRDIFCDVHLEFAKMHLQNPPDLAPKFAELPHKERTEQVVLYVMDTFLRALHPFAPFITEDLWQRLVPTERFDKPDVSILTHAAYPEACALEEVTKPELVVKAHKFSQVLKILAVIRPYLSKTIGEKGRLEWSVYIKFLQPDVEGQLTQAELDAYESAFLMMTRIGDVRILGMGDPIKRRETEPEVVELADGVKVEIGIISPWSCP